MLTVKHWSTVSTLTWSLMHQLLLLSLYRYLLTDKFGDSAKRLMLVCFGYWVTMRMFSREIRFQMWENFVNIDTSLMKEKKSLSAVESEEQHNKQLSHHHCFVNKFTTHYTFKFKLKVNRTVWIEPRHEISNNVVCATSEGSNQPAHVQSDQSLC